MSALTWNPRSTRAFIVSIAKFEGKRKADFSIEDRLDPALAAALQNLGVPPGNITHLQDREASAENLRREFSRCLRASQPGEQLIFYFGSHGETTARRDGFLFSAYDEYLPFSWALEGIEKEFKGGEALLFPDCCYSGGMVEMLARRPASSVACAALSSTHAHNIAWNGWSFIDCLLRALAGDARVDAEGDGVVDWQDLCHYTARRMALWADGRPMDGSCNGFNPHLRLSAVSQALEDPQVGQYVQVLWEKEWYNAEILETRGGKYKIRYAECGASDDEWVTPTRMRGISVERLWAGAPVEVQSSADDEWYPARVLQSWETLHFCRYDDYGPEYDEWFGPSRIRRRTGS